MSSCDICVVPALFFTRKSDPQRLGRNEQQCLEKFFVSVSDDMSETGNGATENRSPGDGNNGTADCRVWRR